MMNGGFTSQVADDVGIGGSDYLETKHSGSLSSSNPLLAREIKRRISSAMTSEQSHMDLSRQSSSSDLSERETPEMEEWSGDMDIDSDGDEQVQDHEVPDDGSSDMDISE